MNQIQFAVIACSVVVTTMLFSNRIHANNNAGSAAASSPITYAVKEVKEEYRDQLGKVRGVISYQYPQ